MIIVVIEISAFSSSLCCDILFCVVTFILQFFSYFVATIDLFIVTYFTSTLCCVCHDILFCVATFILKFFSSFVATIDFFIATYFTSTLCCVCRNMKLLCHEKVVLLSIAYSNFVSRQSFLLLRQSFFSTFSFLCRDRVEKCCDKVPLPFALINVATELSFIATKFCLLISFMSQHSLLNLSQHFSINLSYYVTKEL